MLSFASSIVAAREIPRKSEAVARAMVAQGAWRRMFNDFRKDKTLASLLNQILEETDPQKKADLIDQLYENNKDRKTI